MEEEDEPLRAVEEAQRRYRFTWQSEGTVSNLSRLSLSSVRRSQPSCLFLRLTPRLPPTPTPALTFPILLQHLNLIDSMYSLRPLLLIYLSALRRVIPLCVCSPRHTSLSCFLLPSVRHAIAPNTQAANL